VKGLSRQGAKVQFFLSGLAALRDIQIYFHAKPPRRKGKAFQAFYWIKSESHAKPPRRKDAVFS